MSAEKTAGSVTVTTWREAEILAAQHMRGIGFTDASVTGGGTDGGIDVVATGAIAQVKFHAMPVGAPDVQRLRGAAHAYANALFYSAAGYTPAAKTYAEHAGVALFSIGPWSRISADNQAADDLISGHSPEEITEITAADEARLHQQLVKVVQFISAWRYMEDNMAQAPHVSRLTEETIQQVVEPIVLRYEDARRLFTDGQNATGALSVDTGEKLVNEMHESVEAFAEFFGWDISTLDLDET